MTIADWIENVNAPRSENGVIVALLPDVEGMEACQQVNHDLHEHWHEHEPIVFTDSPLTAGNSVPHMTLLPFNCSHVDALVDNLDAIHACFMHPRGLRGRAITLHANVVSPYVERATMKRTSFACWWIDPASASLNVPFMDLARLVFYGDRYRKIPACKDLGTPDLPRFDMTASEREMLKGTGYAYAGQWHVTVGFMTDDANVPALVGPREAVVHFGHLALGRAGRNGTLVEVLKTWPLS